MTTLLCFSILCTVSESIAQDSTSADTVSLGDATVSAVRITEVQKEQASYHFSIESADIIEGSAQSTADILQADGNIIVQKSQQGGGSPILRGFEANKVVLVIDGVRMNNLIYRGGHLQNIITIDPLSLEGIDVMLGQGSTLFGSDALGGVIYMKTKNAPKYDGQRTQNIQAFSKYSSVNHGLNTHLDYSLTGPKVSLFTGLSYSAYQDLRMGSYDGRYPNSRVRKYYIEPRKDAQDVYTASDDIYLQKFSGYSQLDFIQKFFFTHSTNTQSTLNLQYSTSSDVPRYDRLTNTTSGDSLRYARWYYGPQERLMVAYTLDRYIPSISSAWTTIASYQKLGESRHKRVYRSPDLQNNEENVSVYGLLSHLKRPYSNGYLQAGFDLYHGRVHSVGYQRDIRTQQDSYYRSRYPDGRNSQSSVALFVLRHWNLGTNNFLDAGGRLGYTQLNSSIDDSSPNPYLLSDFHQKNPVYSFDISYKCYLPMGWDISANLGTGYRVPNLDDLAKIFDSAPGYIIVPNTKLRPEETINLNINLHYKPEQTFEWSFSPFVSRMVDAIATRPYLLDGRDSVIFDGVMSQVVANQNYNKAWIYGFNTRLEARLSDELNLYTRLSYTYGEVQTKDGDSSPVDHIPPLVGKVGLTYERSRWRAELYTNFNGAKKLERYSTSGEDNLNYAPTDSTGNPLGMPRWQTLNIAASIKVHPDWTLSTGIENIMDLRYQVFASGILAPGRNTYISLRWNRKY